jgi:hypothetical protein
VDIGNRGGEIGISGDSYWVSQGWRLVVAVAVFGILVLAMAEDISSSGGVWLITGAEIGSRNGGW